MKTFNDILNELAEPKARKEKEFKDKHVVQKIDHPVTDMDALTAKSMKKDKTKKASLHADKDEAVYEEVEVTEDITKMSHGRLKWHMNTGVPHGSYTKDEMKKERDRRLSRVDTHAAYKKAKAGLSEAAPKIKHMIDTIKKEREKNRDHDSAMGRTPTGRKKPVRSMTSTQKSLAKMRGEEVEKINELSKKTLGSYVKKAASDIGYSAEIGNTNKELKRHKGLAKAVDKITKESVDLDEGLYHVEYGRSGKLTHQVVAKDAKDAHQKAMAHLKKKNPKLAHPDYADTFHKPSITHIKGNEPRADKYKTEEIELDEAVEVSHDRYMRSHGKRASGGHGMWMFTHKRMGDANVNDPKEVHSASGKFSDAKKSAQQWAKKHGHSTVYVMEEVEQLDELSPNTLHSYIKGASKDLAKRSRMSGYDDKRGNYADGDKNRKRANKRMAGITSASGRLADKANQNEEVKLDEVLDTPKAMQSYKNRNQFLEANALGWSFNVTTKKHGKHEVTVSRFAAKSQEDAEQYIKNHPMYKKHKPSKIEYVKESVDLDEVLDTPKAMQSYKNKANRSLDRASNSAIAKMLRNPKGPQATDISKETETMDKRKKGLKMADRNAARKTFKALRKEEYMDEAFKAGSMKLKDGSSVKVTSEQASSLNALFNELNSSNKKKMEERLMSSSKGFNEILSFAKEAL